MSATVASRSCIPVAAQHTRELGAGLEGNLQLVADQFESVPLVPLVPHAPFVGDVRVCLPSVVLFAVRAVVYLVVLVGVAALLFLLPLFRLLLLLFSFF